MKNARAISLLTVRLWVFICLLVSCGQNDTQEVVDKVVPETVMQPDTIQDPIQLPITENDKLESQRNAPEKANWKTPPVVFEKLGSLDGMTVADIGAGVGYLSFQLILRKAKVIAIDTDPASVDMMNLFSISHLTRDQQSRFEARVAEPHNPNLKKNEVDRVLIVNVVTFLGNRKSYLEDLRTPLKPGGKLMIMDFKMKRIDRGFPEKEYRIYPDILEEELYAAGYQDINIDDTSLNAQYIITATNPE